MSTDAPVNLTSIFDSKWLQSTADAIVGDLQRNLHWRAIFGAVPDPIREQEAGWCFDRPSHTVQQYELDAWRFVLKHPELLRGALADWAERSPTIERCPPSRTSLECFGLATSDVQGAIRELARHSPAIRSFVLGVTKHFVECAPEDCGRETFIAARKAVKSLRARCVEDLQLELLHCVLPGYGVLDRASKDMAVCAEIPLSVLSTQLMASGFPSHVLVLDRHDSPPTRDLVSTGGAAPCGVQLDVTDAGWQARRDYLEASRRSARLYQQQISKDEIPSHESLNTEPVLRDLPLSTLTLRIRVRGAADYRQNAARRLLPSVRGAFKAIDCGLLADANLRDSVFSSILRSVRRGKRQKSARNAERRFPEFLGLGGLDWSPLDTYLTSDLHWLTTQRFRMRSAWVEFMATATAKVDESALMPMLELCLARPAGAGSRRGSSNPIAKGLGDLDRASRVIESQPRDALVIAVTSLESTVLWRLPRHRDGDSAPKKSDTLQRRIAILFGCDSDDATGLVRRWVRDIYNTRSEVVHGEFVADDDAAHAASSAVFLAGVCMLKICASVRFRARIGAEPTHQSCDAALADYWEALDCVDTADQESLASRSASDIDPRIDHFDLAGWPACLMQVGPHPSR